jgi:hypothetical protein
LNQIKSQNSWKYLFTSSSQPKVPRETFFHDNRQTEFPLPVSPNILNFCLIVWIDPRLFQSDKTAYSCHADLHISLGHPRPLLLCGHNKPRKRELIPGFFLLLLFFLFSQHNTPASRFENSTTSFLIEVEIHRFPAASLKRKKSQNFVIFLFRKKADSEKFHVELFHMALSGDFPFYQAMEIIKLLASKFLS